MLCAIRVDTSAAIGLGHLHRCVALAHALRKSGAEVVFVTRALGVDTAALIAAAGFKACTLPCPVGLLPTPPPAHAEWAGVDWSRDATETAAALDGHDPDWLLVDSYALDARWHDVVADALGVKIAVVDDLADRPVCASLLIDHNIAEPDHRRKYADKLNAGAAVLGGPTFALLGPKFASAPRYEPNAEVRSLGIFLGGTDPAQLSETVLRACRAEAGFTGPVELVTTGANPRLADLQALVANWPRTTLSFDLPDLSPFFARHDLQIGAGGGAIWERCCIGAPTLALICAENQLLSLPVLHKLGVLHLVGDPLRWRQVTRTEIAAAVCDLIASPIRRADMGRRSRALVDGHGALRVAQWMTSNIGRSI